MPADPLKTNTSASRAACLFVLRFAFALFGLTGLLLGTVTGLPNSLGTQVHSPCVYDGYARRQGCAGGVPRWGSQLSQAPRRYAQQAYVWATGPCPPIPLTNYEPFCGR